VKALAPVVAIIAVATVLATPTVSAQGVSSIVLSGTIESVTSHSLVLRHGPWDDTLVLTSYTIASNGVDSVPADYVPLQGAHVQIMAVHVPEVGLVSAIIQIQ
jgi:hypothetical protein